MKANMARNHSPGERGVALVMVLILSAISLAIMAGLVFMLTASTQMSGIQKRYTTAMDAGRGGTDVVYQLIMTRGTLSIANLLDATHGGFPSRDVGGTNCLDVKLNEKTTDWGGCSSTGTIDINEANPDTATTYDIWFDLGTTVNYRVFGKIVDTVEGNSGGDEGLLKSGVVSANSGEVTVKSMPYLYTIEVDAARWDPTPQAGRPKGVAVQGSEKAMYSVLYQY